MRNYGKGFLSLSDLARECGTYHPILRSLLDQRKLLPDAVHGDCLASLFKRSRLTQIRKLIEQEKIDAKERRKAARQARQKAYGYSN